MTTNVMDCAGFDDRLADYLEGGLGLDARRDMDVHLVSCLRCSALVRDIEQIRVDAAALPALAPAADLWHGIAARIDAPVIPLTAQASAAGVRRRWRDRARLAAVAAGLVAISAGVTYTLTMSKVSADNRARTVAATPAQPSAAESLATSDSSARGTDAALPGNLQVAAANAPPEPASAARESEHRSISAPPSATTRAVRNVPASVTYSREIDRLRTIFTQNRNQLDPRTAAIIEANLKVIDQAIAQSRAALAQDPASRFLDERLNDALEKKLELLRRAALLPNRST